MVAIIVVVVVSSSSSSQAAVEIVGKIVITACGKHVIAILEVV